MTTRIDPISASISPTPIPSQESRKDRSTKTMQLAQKIFPASIPIPIPVSIPIPKKKITPPKTYTILPGSPPTGSTHFPYMDTPHFHLRFKNDKFKFGPFDDGSKNINEKRSSTFALTRPPRQEHFTPEIEKENTPPHIEYELQFPMDDLP